MDEAFYRRIQRKDEYFAAKRVGAVGACLTSLAAFFSHPWRQLAFALSPADTGYVLSNVGFYLGAVGRYGECAEPLSLALETSVTAQQWHSASVDADNLSDAYLTLGSVAAALRYALQAIEFAIRSRNETLVISRAVTLADTLHAAGSRREAGRVFAEAEALHNSLPLSGMGGFLYGDLLLRSAVGDWADAGDRQRVIREIQVRIEQYFESVENTNRSLYVRALPRLLIGRTCGLLDSDLSRARGLFDEAMSLLREASQANLLAMGLVWRAEF